MSPASRITTLEAADRYLREVYLPEHNARFAIPSRIERSGTHDRPHRWVAGEPLGVVDIS